MRYLAPNDRDFPYPDRENHHIKYYPLVPVQKLALITIETYEICKCTHHWLLKKYLRDIRTV